MAGQPSPLLEQQPQFATSQEPAVHLAAGQSAAEQIQMTVVMDVPIQPPAPLETQATVQIEPVASVADPAPSPSAPFAAAERETFWQPADAEPSASPEQPEATVTWESQPAWQPAEGPAPIWTPAEEPSPFAASTVATDAAPVPDFTIPVDGNALNPAVTENTVTGSAWNPVPESLGAAPAAPQCLAASPEVQAFQQDFGIPATPPPITIPDVPQTAPAPFYPSVQPVTPVVPEPMAPAPVAAVPPPPAASPAASSTDVVGAAGPLFPETTYSGGRPVSAMMFKVAVSYASAMTLACLYLLYMVMTASYTTSNLESLPDLAPPKEKKDKKTSLHLVPIDAPMPPKHTLKFNETVRYGSVNLTPLRVTRGPLEFVHYDPAAKQTKERTSPVLKLHLRFDNVSQDQDFPPLDRDLVFNRQPDRRNFGAFLANNFVCNLAEKKKGGKYVLMYDLAEGSSFDLKDEHLGRVLNPGESFETFVATTEEDIDTLSGQLLWRVHFRKGYNPVSLRGVTTIVEVVFDSDQIENEPGVTAEKGRAEPEAAGKKAA